MRGTFWTEPEDALLIELREAGLTHREIAARIDGRGFNGVRRRLFVLRSRRRVR